MPGLMAAREEYGPSKPFAGLNINGSLHMTILGQLDLLKNWKETKAYSNDVYLLPKELDEKVANLHLPALGAELTTLSKEQADYIGVKVNGPFKGDTYRY